MPLIVRANALEMNQQSLSANLRFCSVWPKLIIRINLRQGPDPLAADECVKVGADENESFALDYVALAIERLFWRGDPAR